jgi:CheY-like chemotaxis protein
MMTEATPPSPQDMGPAPENGSAQSQGHRRRRRRRKNKSQQAAAQAQPQPPAQGQPQMQAPPPPPPPPRQPQHHQGQGQNQGQGRKKKKFFQKQQGPQAQPGNSVNAPQQGKRRGRQKGPREFVGPMDHSYRAVNGNIADGPPSTIQMPGNHHASYYPDTYAPPAVPVRADAPTRIFCFIEDLFFLAKIQETARKLGVKVEFVKGSDKEAVARVTEAPDAGRPTLIVFDLNNANAKPLTLIPKIKTKYKKAVSIIGFLSHLQGDLKMKGIEAGCDTVMPRSAFSQSLPNLLRRYGVEEEEDYAQQPV